MVEGLTHKLGLGTVQFGMNYGVSNTDGKTNRDEVEKIIEYCIQHGISVIDTASGYGDAERILGEIGTKQFKIISKFLPNGNPKTFWNQIEKTLNDLKRNKIYAYLAHRPLNICENKWEWDCLLEAKKIGLTDKIGVSLNKPAELLVLFEKNYVPDLIQVPYNYLDRRFEKLFPEIKAKEIEIHSRSCFLQGLLLMNPDHLNEFFNPLKSWLKRLQLHYNPLTPSLISFCLANPNIDSVIIGVNKVSQLKESIEQLPFAQKIDFDLPDISEKLITPSEWPI